MSTFYCQAVPDSHWFTNLEQLLPHSKTHLDLLTKDHMLIGLRNSIKHGYKLKPYREIDLKRFDSNHKFFTSIELMVKYIESKNFNVDDFLSMVDTTWDVIGLNLNNGIIMEKQNVYKVVDGELEYQNQKWDTRNLADGVPDEEKDVAEWVNYIEYHLSKAKDAVYHLNKQEALAEIRKVTALGVRTMMIHGCPERVVEKFEGMVMDGNRLMGGKITLTNDKVYKINTAKPCSCDDCDCKK